MAKDEKATGDNRARLGKALERLACGRLPGICWRGRRPAARGPREPLERRIAGALVEECRAGVHRVGQPADRRHGGAARGGSARRRCGGAAGAVRRRAGAPALFGIVKLGWLLPQNSFRILRTIRLAFPDQPLWSVENPILPGPAARARRMQRKVAAGAQAILTQPPFLWGRFTRWLAEVERLGVTVPIICGVPIITSPLSLRTWLFLVGFTGSHAETDALLERLRQAEARGEAAEEGMRYTVELLQRLRATPASPACT